MIVFVGMETSGVIRRAFQARGVETYSCDLLPARDGDGGMVYTKGGQPLGCHYQGDIFETLEMMRAAGKWPDLGIFHPDCTYLTASAEWAYGDGPYHQEVKPGTLVGAERREAREVAIAMVERIWALPIRKKCVENPVGVLSSRFRKPSQVIQPNWFGDDASKKTCLWLDDLPCLVKTKIVRGRFVRKSGWETRFVERWENQTDTGQNRLSDTEDRWQLRADTYPGIAEAMVEQWLNPIQGRLFA